MLCQIHIRDREAYGRYEAGFMAVFDQYGGEMLAVTLSVTWRVNGI